MPAKTRPSRLKLLSSSQMIPALAVSSAQRAVAPDFTGDRASQARRAVALLEAAKVEVTSTRAAD